MNYNKAYKQDRKKNEKAVEMEAEKKVQEEVKEGPKPTFLEYIGWVANAEQVYMREAPSKESESITIVDEGAELMILDDSNEEWYKACNPSGIEGYIMKKFVTV